MTDNHERSSGEERPITVLSSPSRIERAPELRPQTPTRLIQLAQLTVGIAAVIMTIVLFWLGNKWQDRRAEKVAAGSRANVSVQGGVQPNDSRIVGEKLEPIRWRAWFFVVNYGPATAKQFFIDLRTASSRRVIAGNIQLVVKPTAAEVKIVPRSSGLHQVVVRNLQPGDGFWMYLLMMPTEDEVEEVNRLWPNQMFSQQFTAHFIETIDGTGENVNVSVDGIYKFGSLSGD